MKLRLSLALCALATVASAATSTAWEVNGFSDFLKGRLTNLSLSADGALKLGPAVRWNSSLDQPALWSVATAPDGSVYAGTGHSGKLYRIGAADGKPSLLWSAGQSEIFALAIDAKGLLYVGTSPTGGVYRIENGQATEIWHSPGKYIWAILPAPDGTLFVATGEQGRVYRLAANGTARVYYETGQGNVTALAFSAGHLYAGTDPNGIIYDITAPQQATILYDSTLPEIRALAVDAKGSVYAAAMGGAVASRSAAPASAASTTSGAVVATSPTVITVSEAKTDAADVDGSALKVSTDQNKGVAAAQAANASGSGVTEVSGVEKSAIYRIGPDHTVETLRSSKNDNVYDILLDGDNLIFSTDDHGRIYRWSSGRIALLNEPGDGSTTRLAKSGANLYAALSNPGRLIAFGAEATGAGKYDSVVHDSMSVARWGHLQWHGGGTRIAFSTRTGNSVRPDATWSKWSEPVNDPNGALIGSPVARFIQWRAEWSAGSDAHLETVDIPYLPQNAPPVVHSISVNSILGSNPSKSGPPAANASSAYSITVTDTGEPPAASTASSASQSVSRLQSTQTQISWQADDPDSDKLVYSIYFRSEDGTAWQLIRSRMFENTLLLDPDVFADGRYYFKIVASDGPSNSAQFARQAELISSPVLIDNTPPLVTLGQVQRNGASVDVDIEAADATSPLRLCEYSVDAGSWQPVESTDGVTDSPRERFHLHLENVRPGEHLLVLRVYDAASNAGLARALVK